MREEVTLVFNSLIHAHYSAVLSAVLLRHPELGVLMCTKCYKSYGRGGWTKDGEGNDEYCRCRKKSFSFWFRECI